jgi:uncharacterized membrane protein
LKPNSGLSSSDAPALIRTDQGRSRMQDALMLLYTVIFFAVAFLYVKACRKLR